MSNLFDGLKTFIVGVLASASTIVTPAMPVNTHTVTPVVNQIAPESASPTPVDSKPVTTVLYQNRQTSSPLPLNNENYITVRGTYSYFGQKVNYLFLVPRNGGSFSGAISGACQAQAGGNYEGGNGEKISGNVSGSCNMFGVNIKGSTPFSGKLYPDSKTVELDISNSPIHNFKVNYN